MSDSVRQSPKGSLRSALLIPALVVLAVWLYGTHPEWLQGTATVQQIRQTKGVTRIWMNDGTVWESLDADAPLLAIKDEIRYEHNPNWPSLISDAASQYPNRDTLGGDEGCYLIDKSRPGLGKFFAFRVVGDPKRESCPAGSPDEQTEDKQTEQGISIDEPQGIWASETEPSGRVTARDGKCPAGYKPVDHLSGPGGYIRHVDCVPF